MKLSVALCTYNGEKFIEDQVNSILNQTIKIDELIVCDDQSTDNTVTILKSLQAKTKSTITIIENESNLKSTKNFEKAIALCTGDYLFLSDQDDIWDKQKAEKTLAVFNENPKAEGVFSNANLIDEQNNIFTKNTIWDSVFFLEAELNKPLDFFDIMAKNGNVVTGATLCIKKEIKPFIIPFSTEVLHDEWIAILLALRKTLYYSKEHLISYRIHENQQVGMKKLYKIEKIRKQKRIILGLDPAVTFIEKRILLKKIYLKIKLIEKLKRNNITFVNFNELSRDSKIEYEQIVHKIKNEHPLLFRITNLIDALFGKRKLKL
jgi:glycosyltransferase involved in cell wall biosynthesis